VAHTGLGSFQIQETRKLTKETLITRGKSPIRQPQTMKDTQEKAFPDSARQGFQEGMDLRDYFAAKAIDIAAKHTIIVVEPNHTSGEIAMFAYLIADAMMKERSK